MGNELNPCLSTVIACKEKAHANSNIQTIAGSRTEYETELSSSKRRKVSGHGKATASRTTESKVSTGKVLGLLSTHSGELI